MALIAVGMGIWEITLHDIAIIRRIGKPNQGYSPWALNKLLPEGIRSNFPTLRRTSASSVSLSQRSARGREVSFVDLLGAADFAIFLADGVEVNVIRLRIVDVL